MPRFTLHFQLQRYPYGDSAVCTTAYRASKPRCNAHRAHGVLANPFLDTHRAPTLVVCWGRQFPAGKECWEFKHKSLCPLGPPGCEDEFKSVFQAIDILRNQQHYGQESGLRQEGSAQAWIFQAGSKEMVKGWSPSPSWDRNVPIATALFPSAPGAGSAMQAPKRGQSCRVRCCNSRRGS